MNINKKYFGFTLAEVLITLVIIGVIVAITVPTLSNKTNKQETISRLKKAYSTMAQATNQIIMDEGPVPSWALNNQKVYELYYKKLKNAKKCDENSPCWQQGVIKNLYGSDWQDFSNSNGVKKFALQDGTIIFIGSSFSANCDLNNIMEHGSINECGRFYVDINGERKPNTVGKDIFLFSLKKDGLHPAGCDIDNLCTRNSAGLACACKVLREESINYY